ncbi:MAG: hypothetical protein MUC58_11755 [Rhizobiaceae bacterium]|jgi:hypothetical protein|nr:hypothetical protein [Rhizobiaceae bacterium]
MDWWLIFSACFIPVIAIIFILRRRAQNRLTDPYTRARILMHVLPYMPEPARIWLSETQHSVDIGKITGLVGAIIHAHEIGIASPDALNALITPQTMPHYAPAALAVWLTHADPRDLHLLHAFLKRL